LFIGKLVQAISPSLIGCQCNSVQIAVLCRLAGAMARLEAIHWLVNETSAKKMMQTGERYGCCAINLGRAYMPTTLTSCSRSKFVPAFDRYWENKNVRMSAQTPFLINWLVIMMASGLKHF
jgi:hypothetical protein